VGAVIATSGTAAALAASPATWRKRPDGNLRAARDDPTHRQTAFSPVFGTTSEGAGIGPRRAEIICAGAVVYAELLERCHLSGFRYSALGLRDGILAQMAADYDRSTRSAAD